MKNNDAYLAAYLMAEAAQYLNIAYGAERTTPGNAYYDQSLQFMRRATEVLGFDLVPRLTAAEAHDLAVQRRVDEDNADVCQQMEVMR